MLLQLKLFLYLCEYFGIALAPVWSVAEIATVVYFGPGYWGRTLGLVRSWDVWLFTLFVFNLASPVGNIVFTFRARIPSRKTLIYEIWNQFKYSFLTSLQWTSYSYRFSGVIMRYLFSIKVVSWGATSKEQAEDVFTDNEFRDVLVPFYGLQILISLFLYCLWSSYTWYQSVPIPEGFGGYTVFFAYFMGPIILNPNLIRLRY